MSGPGGGGLAGVVVEVAQDVHPLDVPVEPDVGVGPPALRDPGRPPVAGVRRVRERGPGPVDLARHPEVAHVQQQLPVARVVRERLREPCVGRLRIEALLAGAAEVDLDRVEPPRREAVGVLLVVAERADALVVTAAPAGIGVDPGQQPVPVQPGRQPRQSVRPLVAVDDQLSAAVSLAARPAEVEPHDPVTGSGQAAIDQSPRHRQDRPLVEDPSHPVVRVPAHVGNGGEHRVAAASGGRDAPRPGAGRGRPGGVRGSAHHRQAQCERHQHRGRGNRDGPAATAHDPQKWASSQAWTAGTRFCTNVR